MQLFLSCGSQVTVHAQLVGYGMGEIPVPSTSYSFSFEVDSWREEDEDAFGIVEVCIAFHTFFCSFFSIPSN